jgi:hypothetical protein
MNRSMTPKTFSLASTFLGSDTIGGIGDRMERRSGLSGLTLGHDWPLAQRAAVDAVDGRQRQY